ncbi:MAG: hypothetical protein QGH20_09010, partial [Candidatus Latescibacteria bacterium]|nr:hypothetical protein [Candidatus Latescibacterota bacterium]
AEPAGTVKPVDEFLTDGSITCQPKPKPLILTGRVALWLAFFLWWSVDIRCRCDNRTVHP